jgi:glutathione S-transferase
MLTFYYHPLSSYCWKALIGLYETGVEFTPVIVNLGDPVERASFLAVWPIGKFPVIQDTDAGEVYPEASIILEFLDRLSPTARLLPTDPKAALRARFLDRVFDLHVHEHMQRVIADRLRPAEDKHPASVSEARARLIIAYGYVEAQLQGRTWLTGDDFGIVECAALPALFYGDKVQALTEDLPLTRAYLERMMARPSVKRVLAEAEPYFKYYPTE